MPDAIWIDRQTALVELAQALEPQAWIGVDTEFLRERTFFPRLCLLQLAAGGRVWCVDTLRVDTLEPLMAALTSPRSRKVLHAARQDLEAVYLAGKQVVAPVFDTQIAAGCIGLKPQIGYADLVKTLLDVTLAKAHTRTDWSKRPLSAAQLEYAADDVLYLGEIAARLSSRLAELGRGHWVDEDCAELLDPNLYEPDLARAWERVRGIAQLAPAPRARAKAIAVWRERTARTRNIPRAWILPDAALFAIAQTEVAALRAPGALQPLNDELAARLLPDLERAPAEDAEPGAPQDARPSPEQKALMARLAAIVDRRAGELGVSAEILAPRGELRALALGNRATHCLGGWRAGEIGSRLLEALE
ncbi:MAG TPA: ribonuclease D [Steroidobacteraceae bacterium]|jgi:ribonuclease D|nr:ribonuclease D [Steroidobacteraceae bacterium]